MSLYGRMSINGANTEAYVVVRRVFGGKQEGYYTAVVDVYLSERFRHAGLKIFDYNVHVPYIEGEDPVRLCYHVLKYDNPGLEADQGVIPPCDDLVAFFNRRTFQSDAPTPAIVVATPVFGPHEAATEDTDEQVAEAIAEIEAAPVEQRPGLFKRMFGFLKRS